MLHPLTPRILLVILPTVSTELQSARGLVERAVVTKESRIMARAVRLLLSLRKKLRGSILTTFVKQNLPADSDVQIRLLGYLSKVTHNDCHLEKRAVNRNARPFYNYACHHVNFLSLWCLQTSAQPADPRWIADPG